MPHQPLQLEHRGLTLYIEGSTKHDGTFLVDIMRDGSPVTPAAIVLTEDQRLKLVDYLLNGEARGVRR